MARVLYGFGVADVRGKVGGQVHGRGKGGSIIRTKVTPINPSTIPQTRQRSFLSVIAKAWSGTLSQAQRNAWTAYGNSGVAKSVFGNGLTLSGLAIYQKVNLIVLTAGGTRVDNAPTARVVDSITSISLVANHTGPLLTLTYTPTPQAAGSGLYIFATPALSPGIHNFNSQLRFLNYTDASASPLELHVAWVALFGAFPAAAGQRIGLKVFVVTKATGAISAAATISTLVI